MCKTTITVNLKDKRKFKDIVNKYDTTQYKLFSALIKIAKNFDVELKEDLKWKNIILLFMKILIF